MPSDTIPPTRVRSSFRISLVTAAFLIGTGLVLLGFAAELGIPILIDYLDSFRNLPAVETTANVSEVVRHPAVPTEPANGHSIGVLDIIVLLLKEAGVAFLVAAIVGWAIERRAHEKDNERAEKLRRGVADDAIFAIYGLRHRRDFINTVVETNLQARVVRQGMKLDYSVRTLSRAEAELIYPTDPDGALLRFVILEMKYRYALRNVSSAKVEMEILYSVPLRQGEGARKITEAYYVCIDDKPFSKDQIKGGSRPDKMVDELAYEWPWTIPAGKTIEVVISSRCLKERSDNEVWGCMFPTMSGMELKLTVPVGMRFGVREISSASLVKQAQEPSEITQTWTVDGPLLRHNSLVLWWRTIEDEGKEEVSPPVDYSPPPVDPEPPAAEQPSSDGIGPSRFPTWDI